MTRRDLGSFIADDLMANAPKPAAQIGEPVEDRAAQKIIEPIIKDAITVAVNATIERCAQMAEIEGNLWSNDARAISEIAAAIRKLKNGP